MEREFLDFALKQSVQEIALESCFFDAFDDQICAEIKARLDDAGVDRVLGWGHPEGLWGGERPDELELLKGHINRTAKLGATRMRITAASMNYAKSPREELIAKVVPMLADAARTAANEGVVLALENHIDFTSGEMLRIVQEVGSDHLRINLDTGNALRLLEDPVEVARLLAPYTVSTHIKDISPRRGGGSPSENFTWWPACPAGEGVIDLPGVVRALQSGGFDGSLCLEVDLIGDEWASLPEEAIVAESLEYLRSIVSSVRPS